MAKKNPFTFWSLVVIGLGLITLAIIGLSNSTNKGGSTNLSAADWSKGNPEAPVTIIEYSDFQCPACGFYFPLLKQLAAEFPDDVQIIYRHFPLTSIHPRAELAAQAAEAAGVQGKFWQMHDLLFENQDTWSKQSAGAAKNIFISYATQLGLDVELFKIDIDNPEIKKAVKKDVVSGNQARVNSTPSLYINGSKINNPRSYDGLRQLVIQALEQNK